MLFPTVDADIDRATLSAKIQNKQYSIPQRISREFVNGGLLRDNFDTTTWLLIGACLQILVLSVFPKSIALFPALLLLAWRGLTTVGKMAGVVRNERMDGVREGKFAARLPVGNGQGEGKAAEKGVCVFLLGARANGPLGMFTPGFKLLADYADEMYADLDANRATNGFLGMSEWLCQSRSSSNEIMTVQYFDSVASLHNFAHGPIHRKGWNWWNDTVAEHQQIAIKHEVFNVEPKAWESIYINYHPTGLGALQVPIPGTEKGDVKFADTTLVDARKGLWRSSAGRMGKDAMEGVWEGYARDPYKI